ncbi:MAG TPA: hypothetical protein VNY52_10905 [Solirubrobacteraceae bacterium]|jgi:hypothetical protein|nr:hypothetical protein [Solirubrobacteraceae bacterium]
MSDATILPGDATILPLRDPLLGDPEIARRRASPAPDGRPSPRGRVGARLGGRGEAALAVGAVAVIVGCCALIVLAAADRPSFLTAPSHYGFFPHWLVGPLGGLWPWFTRSPKAIKALFTGALVLMYVAYLVGFKTLPGLRARWTIAAVVGAHAILVLSPPLSLTDVFNYVNYGRMGVLHHLNPYTTIPVFEPHSDPSYDLSNWHQLLSPYGPLFTLLTYAVVPLGIAGSLWVLKSLLMAVSLATVLLVWKCARLLGRDPVAAIALFGLNPIVLVWGLGGDHNDFLTVFFIVLAFYLLLRARAPGISPDVGDVWGISRNPASPGEASVTQLPKVENPLAALLVQPKPPVAADAAGARRSILRGAPERMREWLFPLAPLELGAGAALASAIALKASAGILVPVLLAGMARAPRRLVQVMMGMAVTGIVLGAGSVAAFGLHLPDLGTQGRLVIPMGLPNVLGLVLGQGGETTTMQMLLSIVLVVAVLGCGAMAWRRRDALSASGWATIALLVTLSWVLPWYVLWVLPMAALSSSRALRTTALVLGAYLILTWMPLATAMDNALGIRPTKTSLGQLHQRYVKELLN